MKAKLDPFIHALAQIQALASEYLERSYCNELAEAYMRRIADLVQTVLTIK